MKATMRSAMERCMMNVLTLDLILLLLNNVMNTIKFPDAATTKRQAYAMTDIMLSSLKVISLGSGTAVIFWPAMFCVGSNLIDERVDVAILDEDDHGCLYADDGDGKMVGNITCKSLSRTL